MINSLSNSVGHVWGRVKTVTMKHHALVYHVQQTRAL